MPLPREADTILGSKIYKSQKFMNRAIVLHPTDSILYAPRQLLKTSDRTFLQEAVGGPLERVPGFDTIALSPDPTRLRCVAFCNGDGLRLNLPPNREAQRLWHEAVGHPVVAAHLVGTVVILVGSDAFLDLDGV